MLADRGWRRRLDYLATAAAGAAARSISTSRGRDLYAEAEAAGDDPARWSAARDAAHAVGACSPTPATRQLALMSPSLSEM